MNQNARALQVALEAARAAGKILLQRRTRTRKIKVKGFRDIVTDADLAANRAIRELIQREFPTHAILSEEDTPSEKRAPRAEMLWIIDPLDGTTNYSRGYPLFSVSIALTVRGRSQVGVVYDPLRDECFYATRGQGAFLNGKKIQPRPIAQLSDALIGCELPRAQELRARGLGLFSRLVAQCMGGRLGGSAALSFCYVGAGRLDGYFHLWLYPWDVAAGMLIAREAGARVAHCDGRVATPRGGSYVVAGRKIFSALLRVIQSENL